MSKKYPITISEKRGSRPDARVYAISFAERWGGRYDLRTFNADGYLRKFLSSFKDPEAVAYAVCEFPLGSFCGSVDLSDVISIAASAQVLRRIPPRSIFIGEKRGLETHCLIVKEHDPEWFQRLIERLGDSDGAVCAVLFDTDSRFQELLQQFQRLSGKRGINEAELKSLIIEGFWIGLGCCGAEDDFTVFTRRFDIEGVRALVSQAVDSDRFEVRAP